MAEIHLDSRHGRSTLWTQHGGFKVGQNISNDDMGRKPLYQLSGIEDFNLSDCL